MEEEELKIKYRNLRGELYSIKNKLQELDNFYNNLKVSLKENIIIDKNIYGSDETSYIEKKMNQTINDLTQNVLPSINNKI